MSEVVELKGFQKTPLKDPLTLEQAIKLLGLSKWPEHWEHWKEGIFLDGITSIIMREGESWVRFNREGILRELDRILRP